MDIKGYRQLTDHDTEAINRVKELGAQIEDRLNRVDQFVKNMRADALKLSLEECSKEFRRIDAAQPERWIAIARTHFQEGLMALTRAIAQPGNF